LGDKVNNLSSITGQPQQQDRLYDQTGLGPEQRIQFHGGRTRQKRSRQQFAEPAQLSAKPAIIST
jgi:hypothetical protein